MTDQKDNNISIKRLSNDPEFYTHVFKRTEKIVSVIFYILSHTTKKDSYQDYVSIIKDKSLKTHEVSLKTLALDAHDVEEGLLDLRYALVSLDSTLRIAEAAGVVPADIALMLIEQLDTVQRYINNHYLKNIGIDTGIQVSSFAGTKKVTARSQSPVTRRPRKVQIPAGDISTDAYMVYSQLTDRAERIKTVLEAKPQASIKDIAEVVTDVSEKTIQRELNSLIEKGQVIREGERRWSKYSVSK